MATTEYTNTRHRASLVYDDNESQGMPAGRFMSLDAFPTYICTLPPLINSVLVYTDLATLYQFFKKIVFKVFQKYFINILKI